MIAVPLQRQLCAGRLHLGDGGARTHFGLAGLARRFRAKMAFAVPPGGGLPDRHGRSRQAELPDRHRQDPGRVGGAPTPRRRPCRARDLSCPRRGAGRRAGGRARRQGAAIGRNRLRRGRRGFAPALAQRQLGLARRDDGRTAALGPDLHRADAGGRQAPLRTQGGGDGRRRRRRHVGADPRRFPAGTAVEGPGAARRPGPRHA